MSGSRTGSWWPRCAVGFVTTIAMLAGGMGVAAAEPSESGSASPGPSPVKGVGGSSGVASIAVTAPDAVSAVVNARLSGHRVEDLSARTQASSTFALPDGTWQTSFATGPVWVQVGGDGTREEDWAAQDSTLVASPDGLLRPTAQAGDVVLFGGGAPDATGHAVVAGFTDPGTGVRSEVLWAGELPKPQVAGNRAVYEGVRPGVDMVVDVTGVGVEQFFVERQRPATNAALGLATRVVATGSEATAQQVRGVEGGDDGALVTGGGDTVAQVGQAVAWDAIGDAARVNPVADGVLGVEGLSDVPVWAEAADASAPSLLPSSSATTSPPATTAPSVAATGGSANSDPGAVVPVATDISASGAGVSVGLDASAFLADPATQFPVVVDPSVSLVNVFDTWVQTGTTVDMSTDTELRLGTYDGGAHVARSFINWDVTPLVGKKVLSAKLSLWEWYSYSCSPRGWDVWGSVVASKATRWTNQPVSGSKWASSTATLGYSSGCAAGWVTQDLTGLADYYATKTSGGPQAVRLQATSETDSAGWKRFFSGNNSVGKPTFTVTYNSYPNTPSGAAYGTGQYQWWPNATAPNRVMYVRTARPTFSAVVTDPDGGKVRATVTMKQGSTTIWNQAAGSWVASGGRSFLTTGGTGASLADGGTYSWYAQANDGSLASKGTSGTNTFVVDVTAPATPTVTSSTWGPSGSWLETDTKTGTFTFSSTSPDTASFTYAMDGGAVVTVPATNGTWTGQISSGTGGHALAVITNDRAGWASDRATFLFGSGKASLTAGFPTQGAKSTDVFQIKASGPAAQSGSLTPSIWWRLSGDPSASGPDGSTTGWTKAQDLPPIPSGTTVRVDASWSAAEAASALKMDRVPVTLDVQVCFTYSAGGVRCTWNDSNPGSLISVVRVPHAFGDNYPTAQAGPGQVALWTGEYNQSTTDVSVPGYVGDLSVSRSYSSQAGTSDKSVFGPGWTASFDGTDIGVAGYTVVDSTDIDGTIILIDDEGEPMVFEQPGGTRVAMKSGQYTAVDQDSQETGAKLVLATSGTGTVFEFTEDDGTITAFAYTGKSGANGRIWVPVSVTEPGTAGSTSFTRDAQGRITRILAPVPPGVTCPVTGTLNKGCRAIDITYATTTSEPDVAGQVTQISYVAWNPAKNATDTVVVAEYEYDSGGRLATVTDPRTGLATSYTYSGTSTSGQPLLATVTPPGQAPFTLGYGNTTVDGESLVTVDRGASGSGDADPGETRLARFVYGIDPHAQVPGLPVVDQDLVAAWGQSTDAGQLPVYGAAVFGPDRPDVAGSAPTDVTEEDWPYAELQYTTDQGRVVNTAEYGAGDWQYTSTGYDTYGNVVRSLDVKATAQLRVLAGTAPVTQPVADSYATITRYNPDWAAPVDISWGDQATGGTIKAGDVLTAAGALVTDVWEPAREIPSSTDPNGPPAVVRIRTHTDYDQGAPTSGINPKTGLPFRLATTVTVTQADAESGSADPGVPIPSGEPVVSQALSGYAPIDGKPATDPTSGWIVGQPTASTTVMPSGNITTSRRFDTDGRVLEVRQPASSGADAATALTGYYTADAQTGVFAVCGNYPEWAGLACQSRTGEATPTKPVTTTTGYSMYLGSTLLTEVLGGVTRTTTTTYDDAGRTVLSATAATGLTGSAPVPPTRTVYDQATGLVTATVSVNGDGSDGQRISTGYDAWGRITTYTDTDGAVTSTLYDVAGRVAKVTDTLHSTSYSYDGPGEHRGLLTGLSVDGVGDFTATYDAAGLMTSQTLPGAVTQELQQDRVGNLTGLTYTAQDATGKNTDLLAWSMTHDIQDRIVEQDSVTPRAGYDLTRVQRFMYDQADRLLSVTDSTGVSAVDNPDVRVDPQAASLGELPAPTCTTRAYGFDVRGNRTSLATTTMTADSGTACGVATGSATRVWAYDLADRVQTGANNQGVYVYDQLGRQTSIPGVDALGGVGAADLAVGYDDTDAALSVTQAGMTTTYTVDPMGRRASSTTSGTGGAGSEGETAAESAVVRHYTDSTDNPAYATTTTGGTTTSTWYGASINGDLAATAVGDQVVLSLVDPQGSVVSTVTVDSEGSAGGLGQVGAYDEYGNPLGLLSGVGPVNYGWLGGKQRAIDASGLVLMGARLYNTVTGQFTSVDPTPGGNTTDYVYPQDPINAVDLDGQWPSWLKKAWKKVKSGAKWLTNSKIGKDIHAACGLTWGIVSEVCSGVYAGAYAVQGRWKQAGIEAAAGVGGYLSGKLAEAAGRALSRTWYRAVIKRGVSVDRTIMHRYDLDWHRLGVITGWAVSSRIRYEVTRHW